LKESVDLATARAAYAQAVAARDAAAMLTHAHALLSLSPTLGTAQQIANTLALELPHRAPVKLKVAFLRSYTVEPCIPFLRALAALHGVELTVRVGEFNSYAQEIIDPQSWLYTFDPQIVILAALTRDLAPDLWHGSGDVTVEQASAAVDAVVSPLASLIGQLRSRSRASLIVQNLEQPALANAGLFDSRREIGQQELIRRVNRKLSQEALGHDGVYVLDYDALVARQGRERWNDEKKWLTSRSPVAADCLILAAREYLRFILPLAGRISKVLAVDLDNTLWGGIVGEDGPTGIKIGPEYPGATYLALQRTILQIADRGVLLAVCSKNNPADALEVLENHPEMLLRPRHFAALRINWTDKAQNLRDIAAELNVGIDSITFLDDNPVERQRIRLELPEVTVIDLPLDPAGYAPTLLSSPVFERLSITAEDRARTGYYSAQRERKTSETSAGSLEDFYRSLEMKSEIVDVTSVTLARIAQLTQKTNQLNMTTRRYTESEVQTLAGDPGWKLFGVRIVDKFGDNGLVGVVFLRIAGDTLEIDTFLLSCRVIGRTVETMMLSRVCEIGVAAGCSRINAWFLPTRKNEPAAKIYADNGFTKIEENADGSLWQLSLGGELIGKPEWIGQQGVLASVYE
jgi:FkbH-like protein